MLLNVSSAQDGPQQRYPVPNVSVLRSRSLALWGPGSVFPSEHKASGRPFGEPV